MRGILRGIRRWVMVMVIVVVVAVMGLGGHGVPVSRVKVVVCPLCLLDMVMTVLFTEKVAR